MVSFFFVVRLASHASNAMSLTLDMYIGRYKADHDTLPIKLIEIRMLRRTK